MVVKKLVIVFEFYYNVKKLKQVYNVTTDVNRPESVSEFKYAIISVCRSR
jgi:hypothetical protein